MRVQWTVCKRHSYTGLVLWIWTSKQIWWLRERCAETLSHITELIARKAVWDQRSNSTMDSIFSNTDVEKTYAFCPCLRQCPIGDLRLCPNILTSINEQCLPLSQLHLSFFTELTQTVKLYFCVIHQNIDVGNCVLKSTEKLREGSFLSVGGCSSVSFLLCSRIGLPKILWINLFS